jgi:hypothetical protein
MARVTRKWKRLVAKWTKNLTGKKPVLDILRLPMTKETLLKMTPEERSLFLLLGYESAEAPSKRSAIC